jgi:hypothetical protein
MLKMTANIVGPSDDEREGDAEQSQRLDQPDADEHVRPDLSGVLGLPGHRLDGLPDQDPQTDARPDGRKADDEALADRGNRVEVTGDLS